VTLAAGRSRALETLSAGRGKAAFSFCAKTSVYHLDGTSPGSFKFFRHAADENFFVVSVDSSTS
jgi:hypothetical protein